MPPCCTIHIVVGYTYDKCSGDVAIVKIKEDHIQVIVDR